MKIKAKNRQEVVIAGFTAPTGSRKHFGALILGVYKDGYLVYAGRTGAGFTDASLDEVYKALVPLITKECPFEEVPKSERGSAWLKPKLICEVEFAEWTTDGVLRHCIFKGLKIDKAPKEVVKESSTTNKDKVFWPKEGYTKGDLLAYYESVAPYMIPHLRGRPLMLKRYPNGIEDKFFFQKNAPESAPKWIQLVERNDIEYLVANDMKSLEYIINLGTIELHAFLSRGEALPYPDYLVLDLDPVDISFDYVVETALAAHELLKKLKLESFCKTSGKRGLHIYIPLEAQFPYTATAQFAELLAQNIHEMVPDFTSLERLPENRKGKVYIDFLQNGEGKTMIAPYSVRAIEGAPVSTPLAWKEVKKGLDPHEFTIQTVPYRLKKKGDLFKVIGKGVNLLEAIENFTSD